MHQINNNARHLFLQLCVFVCSRFLLTCCSKFSYVSDCVLSFQFTLGGFEELQEMKVRGRERLNLPPLPEDSIKVVRAMRAASPPASAMELIEQQQQQKRGRRSRRVTIARPNPTLVLLHA